MRTIYTGMEPFTLGNFLCRAFVVEDGRFICAGSDRDLYNKAMKGTGDE